MPRVPLGELPKGANCQKAQTAERRANCEWPLADYLQRSRSMSLAAAREFRRKALMFSPDHIDDIIDHLFDATEGIDALRDIDGNDEEVSR